MLDINSFKKNIKSIKIKVNKKNPVFFLSTNLFNLGLSIDDLDTISNYLVSEFCKFKNSTIVVPTATLNILESRETFDRLKSKSSRMGFFSEFIRTKKNSVRSDHPLWSFSAIGYYSKQITEKVPKTCYGRYSIFDRLLNYNTYYICLGDVKSTLAPIHYAEQMVGVPYRFFKEFKIKIKINKKIKFDSYYFYAMISSPKITRENNNIIVQMLIKNDVIKKFKNKNFNIYLSDYDRLIKNLILILDKNPKIYLNDQKVSFNKNLNFK